jgi:hypothetical protein
MVHQEYYYGCHSWKKSSSYSDDSGEWTDGCSRHALSCQHGDCCGGGGMTTMKMGDHSDHDSDYGWDDYDHVTGSK